MAISLLFSCCHIKILCVNSRSCSRHLIDTVKMVLKNRSTFQKRTRRNDVTEYASIGIVPEPHRVYQNHIRLSIRSSGSSRRSTSFKRNFYGFLAITGGVTHRLYHWQSTHLSSAIWMRTGMGRTEGSPVFHGNSPQWRLLLCRLRTWVTEFVRKPQRLRQNFYLYPKFNAMVW